MSAAGFRAFADRFCQAFGATAISQAGRLHVALPPDLAAHFGRDALVWTFTPHDDSGDLVAYGSRAFEEMLALLGGHGRLTSLRLPVLIDTEVETRAPESLGGACELLDRADAPERFYVFNFQLAFTCDERVERLFTVCLDLAGRERPDMLTMLGEQGDSALTVDALAPTERVEREAETRAIAMAEAWVGPMEVQALNRLEALGERLVAYYEAQMREVPIRRRRGQSDDEAVAEAEELRWQLRRELERKLRDETARHQMRVQVRRISLALLEVPGVRQIYQLTGSSGSREFEVWHDQHTGKVHYPACERCAERTGRYGVCLDGHLACAGCLTCCGSCGGAHCHAELNACSTCGLLGCTACRTPCASGHVGCASHLSACSGCGQALCSQCERPHGCGFGPP
jgi:hypothetical protein